MNLIDVGSVVKINPDIFGTAPKESDLYGDLGYVGITRHLNFQVQRIEKDTARGQIAYCTVMNPKDLIGIDDIKDVNVEGECIIIVKDLVPAVVKVTLDYTVDVNMIDNNKVVANLLAKRKELKLWGVGDAGLRTNWKAIKETRAQITQGIIKYPDKMAKVTLTKQHVTFDIETTSLPKDDEKSINAFKMMLIRKLKTLRAERKALKYTFKTLYYESVAKLGGVYIEGGQPVKAYERSLITTLREDKVPKNKKSNYVGVEIEFIHTADNDILEELFIKARLHKHVQLTKDNSVKPCHNQMGYMGSELRILATVEEAPEIFAKIEKVLLDPRVDSYVNRSCGLHVHLDMRMRKAALVYKNFFRIMSLLTGSQPIGRTTGAAGKFCVPNLYEDMNKAQGGLDKPKYVLVNPHPYHEGRNTIEIRVHEGTVNAEQITNWVMFLNTIADHDEEIPVKAFKKAKELNKIVKLPAPCIEYVDSRIAKFGHVS